MKKYDITVKTGTFTDRNGEEKGRYENIGEVHANKEGNFYARFNAFRLLGIAMAGIAKGDDSIMASLFAPRGDDAKPQATSQAPARRDADFDDDIPF